METTPDGVNYYIHHFRNKGIYGEDEEGWSQWGGRTRVVLMAEEGKEALLSPEGKEIEGWAYCQPDENYNRRLGRAIALGRALKMLETGQPQKLRWFEAQDSAHARPA